MTSPRSPSPAKKVKRQEAVRKRIREFGKVFRESRRLLKITLKEVSIETGVSVASISRFERGDFGSMKAETYLLLDEFYSLSL